MQRFGSGTAKGSRHHHGITPLLKSLRGIPEVQALHTTNGR
jgi:DNA-binding Lrp family transcriptional regulator